MTTSLNAQNEKLVIAVSSRALFDLEEEHRLFEREGFAAYRTYQVEHQDVPLKPGVAFPFISRLLKLNEIFKDQAPVRVVVLSRNSPETGQRFFNSCRHYSLPIEAGAFTSGQSTFPFMKAFNASLFLSANIDSVRQATSIGLPAGLVLPTSFQDEEGDTGLRIAFDFDGVVAGDEAEKKFQSEGMKAFSRKKLIRRCSLSRQDLFSHSSPNFPSFRNSTLKEEKTIPTMSRQSALPSSPHAELRASSV